MVRKRLGDLLREEVQKAPEQNSQEVESTSLESEIADEESVDLEQLPAAEVSAEELDEIPVESSTPTSTANSAKRTNLTKAELEKKVSELGTDLQVAQRQNKSLEQQVADLQSDLQQQKTLVKTLQAELEQKNQLKTELEQAKQMILQLSELNSPASPTITTSSQKNKDFRSNKPVLNQIPHHSIQADSPSIVLSDSDIGWVD